MGADIFSRKRWALWLAASLALVLAACASTPPAPPPLPSFKFDAYKPIPLYAEAVEVEQVYVPPLRDPFKEHEFRLSPSDVARMWAEQRVAPAGDNGTLTMKILDGSVKEEALPAAPGEGPLSGFRRQLKDEPDRRLNARLKVELHYEGDYGQVRIEAVVTGQVDVNRHASLNIREGQYFEMLELMAADLDEALTRRVRGSMGELILTL